MQYFKKFFICCLLLFSTLISFTQNLNNTITGKIFNQYNKPLENVNAILQNAKDSFILKANFTNKEGIYTFENIKSGSYYIKFSSVGFTTAYSQVFTIDTQSINLNNTILQVESKKLNDVVVTGTKPIFENKRGVIIMNIDDSPTSVGNTALELLEKAPGVTINRANTNTIISLKGKQEILITIDGKPTYLSGEDLINILANTLASTIDRVEIVATASAKYDAGNAGVINIITKKGKQFGFNGSNTTSYSQGLYPLVSDNLNFNYRTNKTNIFGNYSYINNADFDKSDDNNYFRNNNGELIGFSKQYTATTAKEQIHRATVGLDYNINKNNTIGIKLSGRTSNHTSKGNSLNRLGNNMTNTINSTLQSNLNDNRHKGDLSSNLNYKSIVNKKGTILNFNMDYAHYIQNDNQSILTQGFDSSGNATNNSFALNGIGNYFTRIYAASTSLSYLFIGGVKIEPGLKLSYINSNNTSEYLKPQGGMWIKDNTISKHFFHKENIYAGYIVANKEFKKWNVELGIRIEHTKATGQEFTTNSEFSQKYTKIFPSLSIQYHLNDKNNINIIYNRSIKRPTYKSLISYTYYIDSLNQIIGNPNLKPAFSNNFEINYTHNNITITANYSSSNDALVRVYGQASSSKLVYQTYENLNNLTTLGLALSMPISIQKWWKYYTYIYLYNTHYKGSITSNPVNQSISTASLKLNNTFNISTSLTAEIGVDYTGESPSVWALSVIKPYYTLRGGLSKTLLHKRGLLTLTGETSTYKPLGIIRYGNVDDKYIEWFDTNRIGISFSYKFGKQTVLKPKEHLNNVEEEKKRAGN